MAAAFTVTSNSSSLLTIGSSTSVYSGNPPLLYITAAFIVICSFYPCIASAYTHLPISPSGVSLYLSNHWQIRFPLFHKAFGLYQYLRRKLPAYKTVNCLSDKTP